MRNKIAILAVAVGAFGIFGGYFAIAQQPTPSVTLDSSLSPDMNDKADDFAQDQSLNQKSYELLSKYRATIDSSERKDLSNELGKIVASQFEVRQRLREKELQRLADQLDRLRKIHQQRSEQKDRIVNDRVQQLIREADGLGWGEAASGPWPGVEVPVQMDLEDLATREAKKEFEQRELSRLDADPAASIDE